MAAEILSVLQTTSPIGVIALLGVVIFYQVKYKSIATNHTAGIPDMVDSLKRIEQSLIRLENEMHTQSNMLTEIRTKLTT